MPIDPARALSFGRFAEQYELAGIDPDRRAGTELGAPGLPSPPDATASFPWTWEVTPDQWCSYLATNSGVAAMPQAEGEQHLDAARSVVARACETTGRATAAVRHQASCFLGAPAEALSAVVVRTKQPAEPPTGSGSRAPG